MEIGKPQRTYTVEPVEDPVPSTAPAPEREEQAPDPKRKPEEVPAR